MASGADFWVSTHRSSICCLFHFFLLLKVHVITGDLHSQRRVKTNSRNVGFPISSRSVKELLYTISANVKTTAVFFFASISQVRSRFQRLSTSHDHTQTRARASHAKPGFYLLHDRQQFKFTCVTISFIYAQQLHAQTCLRSYRQVQPNFSYAC